MEIGKLVHDWALRRNGIVVGAAWIEPQDPMDLTSREIMWEWEVLYGDGEILGADTCDLVEVK